MRSRKAYRFSGTARVEEGVPKCPDVFLHRPERPVEVQVLQERARIVAFRVGAHQLLQALQPVAHQLRLAQLFYHRRQAAPGRHGLGSILFHRHLLVRCRTYYAIRPFTEVPRSRGLLRSSKLSALCLPERTPLPIRVLGHPDTLPRRCKTSWTEISRFAD